MNDLGDLIDRKDLLHVFSSIQTAIYEVLEEPSLGTERRKELEAELELIRTYTAIVLFFEGHESKE